MRTRGEVVLASSLPCQSNVAHGTATEVKATFDPTISSLPASVQKYRWSIDEIERRLQHKIEQRTSKRSDQFRQAFRLFDKNVSSHPEAFSA